MPQALTKLRFRVCILHSVADHCLCAGFSANLKQRLTCDY